MLATWQKSPAFGVSVNGFARFKRGWKGDLRFPLETPVENRSFNALRVHPNSVFRGSKVEGKFASQEWLLWSWARRLESQFLGGHLGREFGVIAGPANDFPIPLSLNTADFSLASRIMTNDVILGLQEDNPRFWRDCLCGSRATIRHVAYDCWKFKDQARYLPRGKDRLPNAFEWFRTKENAKLTVKFFREVLRATTLSTADKG